MKIGIVKETFPGERRVALVPATVQALVKAGHEVHVETRAGVEAGFPDEEYRRTGAVIESDRRSVFTAAALVIQVRTPSANPRTGPADLPLLGADHTLIGLAEPLSTTAPIERLAQTGCRIFALELMPRITRAQSMDVLSSQATVAGYEAVLLAAQALPKMFPMMMTAAGTLAPAKVFVIGAGVAGLQAIATAKRLGGVVSAYDIRSAVRDQVESVGARFLQIEIEAGASEDKGGYARGMDEAFYRRQRELMTEAVSRSDVVITTAAVPGKKAPVLVTADMVAKMAPGSVIVDLAAERGGNCELTRPDETVVHQGVTILGPTNLPSAAPHHASQMYSKNVHTFLQQILRDGELVVDKSDEVVEQTLLTEGGRVVQRQAREVLGLDSAGASSPAGPPRARAKESAAP
jgi:NAD(P) transhydrogenase subunit alpha